MLACSGETHSCWHIAGSLTVTDLGCRYVVILWNAKLREKSMYCVWTVFERTLEVCIGNIGIPDANFSHGHPIGMAVDMVLFGNGYGNGRCYTGMKRWKLICVAIPANLRFSHYKVHTVSKSPTSIASNFFESLWDFSTTFRRRRNLFFRFRLQIFQRRVGIFSNFFIRCFFSLQSSSQFFLQVRFLYGLGL